MDRRLASPLIAATLLVSGCAAPVSPSDSTDADRLRIAQEADSTWEYLARLYDADSDGQIVRAEYPRSDTYWASLDTSADGVITQEEIESRRPFWREAGRERPPAPAYPGVGELAPVFDLAVLDDPEGRSVRLDSFRGNKPVALVFGSYT